MKTLLTVVLAAVAILVSTMGAEVQWTSDGALHPSNRLSPTFRNVTVTSNLVAGSTNIVGALASKQDLDADLTDLADGSLTGTKVGFSDPESLWTAINIEAALAEMNDSINAGSPNGSGAKVHWSQILGIPSGIADGDDAEGAAGSGDDVFLNGGAITHPDFDDSSTFFRISTGTNITGYPTNLANAQIAAAANIAESKLDSALARDSEVAAGYQPLDADLTALARADQADLAGGTSLTIGRHYYDDLSANRTLTFSGSPAENDWIQLNLVSTNNPTLTIPSSLRVGLSYAAITSLVVSNGVHTLQWHRVDGLWYLHDTVPTSGGSGVGVTDGDKGHIVVSGAGEVWEIDDAVITDDMVIDVSITKITGLEGIAELESHLGTNIITEDEILLFDSNWEAVGTTNSSLAGEARLHSLVVTQSITLLGSGGGNVEFTTAASAPETPATDIVVVYAKNDNHLYSKDEAGVERILSTRTGVERSIWIPAGAMTPGNTNGAAAATVSFGSSTNYVTKDVFDFDDSSPERIAFNITFPHAWDYGTIKYRVYFYSGQTSGTAEFGLAAKSVADNESDDVAWGTMITVSKAVSGTANRLNITSTSSALTIATTPAINENVDFVLWRVTTDTAVDNLTGDARVAGIMLYYTETITEPSAP